MNNMIAYIAAAAIGGVFILTLITMIIKVQIMGANTASQFMINNQAENIVRMIEEDYLSNVGVNIPAGRNPIIVADEGQFSYFKRNSLSDSLDIRVDILSGDRTANGVPLRIDVNGAMVAGPYFLADTLRFSYYNVKGRRIATPADSLAAIRILRGEAEFFVANVSTDYDRRHILNRITFFKFLKNLYFM